MSVYHDLKKSLEKYFEDVREGGFSYKRIEWELDNLIYPYIGNFLATGDISRDEARELFRYCEERLKEFREDL
ncbi:hypothetical protein [Geoglobus acetivorans]|uniref:Pyruvate carboxylase subunit B n=1 Tax=Geoglobus acetivorans TaxID=565033 RepID=A0A0A7GI34_GEOAI|nr:hypothetical protein GACE_1556 [Geoglobus acetivorans]